MNTVILAASLVYWVAMVVLARRVCRRVPDLLNLDPRPPEDWPKVSIIVPARDEAATLGPALHSRLGLHYPALEFILVDDRSTDATSSVARRVAKEDDRLRVLRLDSLPRGWVGKVHAMQRGVEQSSGEWLLLCDADVHLEASALRRVIAYAEEEQADHVTMLPGLTTTDPTLVCTLATFLRQLCVAGRLGSVADPRSTAAVGIGAFNLVRRDMFERTAGFSALRMALNDDLALGRMLKQAGARQRVLNGSAALTLEFCPSFYALTRTLEKNGGTASALVIILGLGVLSTLELGFLAGVFSTAPWAVALGVIGWACASLSTLRISAWLRLPRWPALVPFLGIVPLAWALGRAAALAWWRGGVFWRGTFYPKDGLREPARVPSVHA